MMAEKRRRAAVAGQDASQVGPVQAAEVEALTKEVYRRADITKRCQPGVCRALARTKQGELRVVFMAGRGSGDDPQVKKV